MNGVSFAGLIMQTIDFDKLDIRKQYRSTPAPNYDVKVIGYDTETIKGKARLICSPTGDCIPKSFDDILLFFCTNKTRNHTGFFYNLKYDFQAILKWLPVEYWKEIYQKGQIEYPSNKSKNAVYVISYLPAKMISIKHITYPKNKRRRHSRTWKFYDISQYYGKRPLDDVAKEYLNASKVKIKADIANLTMSDIRSPEIRRYCRRDADLTEKLAIRWIEICHKNELYPSNFCSPASIAARYFQSHVEFPTINRFLKPSTRPLLHIIWNTVAGAFICCYKRGTFDRVYEYDINSAYPAEMAKLPDISRGRFFYKRDGYRDDAHLAWLRVFVTITDDGFYNPPLPILRRNLPNYNPVGFFETYITLTEYHALKDIYKIDIVESVNWVPDQDPFYLFKDIVETSYTRRKQTDDENINYFLKIVLNGIYGKNLEKHRILDETDEKYGLWRTGPLFNPCYASYILAGSRLKVFDLLQKIDDKYKVACFTDSILSTERLKNIGESQTLGDWCFNQTGRAVIIGCGVYSLKPKGKPVKSKVRGFNTTSKVSLFDILKAQYKNEKIEIDIKTNVSIMRSIIRKNPATMNFILDETKDININFDSKRFWFDNFKRAGDILEKTVDSFPIVAGLT